MKFEYFVHGQQKQNRTISLFAEVDSTFLKQVDSTFLKQVDSTFLKQIYLEIYYFSQL